MIVLFDIDGVLADNSWREPLKDVSMDGYFELLAKDPAIPEMVTLCLILRNQEALIGITSRPERYRKETLRWLGKHRINLDTVFMRPEGDTRPSPDLKVGMIDWIEDWYRWKYDASFTGTYLVIDDREDVIAAFHKLGISTLK